MDDENVNLFNPAADSTRLFEIYQMLVEMADRVSSRRQIANTFFLSINSGIIALIFHCLGQQQFKYLWILNILAMVISWAWLSYLDSSKKLNGAKYQVIQAIEKKLPVNAYTVEWALLTKDKPGKSYKRLSRIESWVSKAFLVLNGFALLVTVCLHLYS